MKRFVSVGECMVELAPSGDSWHVSIAGDTFNTAWYVRALLPDSWEVAYLTSLGADPFSERALQVMRENGIATDLVQRHPSRSIGLYAITLKDGERSFAYWRDTSAARTLADDQTLVDHALQRADVIHVSGITLAILPPEGRVRLISALSQARARGATTVLDPNYRPRLWPDSKTAARVIADAAQAASVVLPSFDDEAALFGDRSPTATAQRYAEAGSETVVVKNAGGGLTVFQDGQIWSMTDLPRVTPIDTTGAGDSFNAGFLAAMLKGASTESSAKAGHALACQVVLRPGALIEMGDLRNIG
ncbi:MAG: sugar kinase [Acetobacteraceae bacterium]|nr:MAG: sugar kinase [Acetobacteraceae bacterium]